MSASTEKKNRQAAREAGTDKKMLAEQEEAKKKAKSKLRWTLGTIGVIVLIAAILFLNSGLLYKTTAFTVGDTNYSASEMNYHYASEYYTLVNQYGQYASMFGIDTSSGLAGLKNTPCTMMENGTWRDYFLDSAKNKLVQLTALTDYAAENDIALDEEELNKVASGLEGLEEYAAQKGYASVDNMFAANYGTGVNAKLVQSQSAASALASKVITEKTDSFEYTEDQLKTQYESYAGERDMFDFVYYLVTAETVEGEAAEGETPTAAPTEETLAAAKAKAQAIEKAYNEGNGEDYLARLTAAVATQVPDGEAIDQSGTDGRYLGDYKEWMMSSTRKAGDVGVTENSAATGYYVTVFIGRNDNSYPTAQVRHILINAEADADGAYTDEAKAAAKAKAEDILEQWKSGEKTEDSFAALAEEYSEDTGSNTNGGLYENIYKGQMVEEFDKFCFGGHKPGDVAVVYGEGAAYAGYHVVYFVGEGENYCDYIARTDLENADLQTWLTELQDGYTTAEGFGMRLVG